MKRLFGMKFYNNSIDDLAIELNGVVKNKKKVSIFTPNVDHIINVNGDNKVKDEYVKSDYIIADGWPLIAVGKLKGIKIERITGVDLMDKLLYMANENHYNIFFLGAQDDTLIKLKQNISDKYPNIDGISYHNGYFNDDKNIIDMINANNTNVLFVGMGNPKQEMWIRNNIDKIDANISIAVGGAFKIFSEEIERAPRWIQKIGMEWFFRFLKEPTRLFSRYFIKYPIFIKYFIKEMLS